MEARTEAQALRHRAARLRTVRAVFVRRDVETRPTECHAARTRSAREVNVTFSCVLGRAPRILLAEDDDELRWALAGALAAQGFSIERKATTSSAIEERARGRLARCTRSSARCARR